MSDATTTKHLYDIDENQERILNNQARLADMLEFLAAGLFRGDNLTRTAIQDLNDAMESYDGQVPSKEVFNAPMTGGTDVPAAQAYFERIGKNEE